MRFAIFSDQHGNLEATEAVLEDAQEKECTHFVCLGDVVGYNANPHECVELVRQMDCPVVKGNHDEQACLGESSRDFNDLAEEAINWTRDHLTDEDKQWLRRLAPDPAGARFHDRPCHPRYARRVGLRLQQSRRRRQLHLPAHHGLLLRPHPRRGRLRARCGREASGHRAPHDRAGQRNTSSTWAASVSRATAIGARLTAFTTSNGMSSNNDA